MTNLKDKKHSQQGSAALAGMLGFAALAMASFYVKMNVDKTNNDVSHARSVRAAEALSLTNMNAVSRAKSLLASTKLGEEDYEPAIFAVNYFQGRWSMLPNARVKLADAQIDKAVNVVVKSPKVDRNGEEEIKDVLEKQKSAFNLEKRTTTLTMLRTIFDADQLVAESVEMQVFSQDNAKGPKQLITRVRIPVDVPHPSAPRVQIRKKGEANFQELPSSIAAGAYDLRLIASGVAFDGFIEINGQQLPVGGFASDKKTFVTEAVSVGSRDRVVGTTTFTFGPGAATTEVQADACRVETTGSGGQVTIRAIARGPDRSTLDKNIVTRQIQVEGGAVQGQELSLNDYRNACKAQCPFVEASTGQVDDVYRPRFSSRKYGDMSEFGLFNDRQKFGVMDKKLCNNFQNVAKLFKDLKGRDLESFTELNQTGQLFSEVETYAYSVPKCEREFLFKRNNCGCFASDTKILLGDGKSEKLISDLTPEDKVWNPMTHKAMSIRKMTRGPEKVPMLDVMIAGASVRVTGKHPFPTKDGLKPAFDLVKGEKILSESGEWVDVTDIVAVHAAEAPIVWNLELDGDDSDLSLHYVKANGIITGDLVIQRLLESKGGSVAKLD